MLDDDGDASDCQAVRSFPDLVDQMDHIGRGEILRGGKILERDDEFLTRWFLRGALPMSETLWRVAPPAHLAEAVRKLVMAEGRTDCNMISRLLAEAISARRNHKAEQIVSAIPFCGGFKMMTPAALALWLRASPDEHASAAADLISSGDIVPIVDGDCFGVMRSHDNALTFFELGQRATVAAVETKPWADWLQQRITKRRQVLSIPPERLTRLDVGSDAC
jgi:hypothetical protein